VKKRNQTHSALNSKSSKMHSLIFTGLLWHMWHPNWTKLLWCLCQSQYLHQLQMLLFLERNLVATSLFEEVKRMQLAELCSLAATHLIHSWRTERKEKKIQFPFTELLLKIRFSCESNNFTATSLLHKLNTRMISLHLCWSYWKRTIV